jgi:hypothetical protein
LIVRLSQTFAYLLSCHAFNCHFVLLTQSWWDLSTSGLKILVYLVWKFYSSWKNMLEWLSSIFSRNASC